MVWLGVCGIFNCDISYFVLFDVLFVVQQELLVSVVMFGLIVVGVMVVVLVIILVSYVDNDQFLFVLMVLNMSVDLVKLLVVLVFVVDEGVVGYSFMFLLVEVSWVEVIVVDGLWLEYGLFFVGSYKIYYSEQLLEICLGNVSGVQVSVDGQVFFFDVYCCVNVVYFCFDFEDGKVVFCGV